MPLVSAGLVLRGYEEFDTNQKEWNGGNVTGRYIFKRNYDY